MKCVALDDDVLGSGGGKRLTGESKDMKESD